MKSVEIDLKVSSGRVWYPGRLLRLLPSFLMAVLLTAFILYTGSVQAADPPVVDGLFYGKGDDQDYIHYITSEHGIGLYVYFDNPTLYVALVVDRSVNDNVFDNAKTPYSESAGWKARSAKKLSDSEFASFELRCETAPLSWAWAQGYARLEGDTWFSDEGGAGAGMGTPPPSYTSTSSFAWNINTYIDDLTPPWDMYVHGGTAITDWKSPFGSVPTTVIGLDGYPATGPITYSSVYSYEWAMVYEWSVNLVEAGCGDDPVYFLAGLSHHSPLKNGDEDENDEFPDPPISPFHDFGDLPNTYSTVVTSTGAAHIITINGAYLGDTPPDMELDGQASLYATGDGSAGANDEDGVTRSGGYWSNGNTVGIEFVVGGQGYTTTAYADIAMWIDWNGDDHFDASEYYSFMDRLIGSVASESIEVPEIYAVSSPLHVRVRIFDDEADAPGGTLDFGDFSGIAESGEVEDYYWTFGPNAVGLQSFGEAKVSGSGALMWLGTLAVLGLAVLSILAVRRLRPIRLSE